MNEVFLTVKKVSEIEFKFVIKRKEKAIVIIDGMLTNGSIIKILAYDELADFIYQQQPDYILFRGEIIENMKVRIKEIYKIGKNQSKEENTFRGNQK